MWLIKAENKLIFWLFSLFSEKKIKEENIYFFFYFVFFVENCLKSTEIKTRDLKLKKKVYKTTSECKSLL